MATSVTHLADFSFFNDFSPLKPAILAPGLLRLPFHDLCVQLQFNFFLTASGSPPLFLGDAFFAFESFPSFQKADRCSPCFFFLSAFLSVSASAENLLPLLITLLSLFFAFSSRFFSRFLLFLFDCLPQVVKLVSNFSFIFFKSLQLSRFNSNFAFLFVCHSAFALE